MMPEDKVLEFAAASLESVWALELLLALKKDPGRGWSADELIRELRGSQSVVQAGLDNLSTAALLIEEEGRFRYHAASPQMHALVEELEGLYAQKPATVVRAIVTSPSKKLQILSDAFKIVR